MDNVNTLFAIREALAHEARRISIGDLKWAMWQCGVTMYGAPGHEYIEKRGLMKFARWNFGDGDEDKERREAFLKRVEDHNAKGGSDGA